LRKCIILVPVAPVKLLIGLWIMLPNFYGEFFMYNLLSDKLDRFEKEIRRYRNKFFGKTTFFFFNMAHQGFNISKPYIHTELLKTFKEDLTSMLNSIEEEFELRRKMTGSTGMVSQAD
jgi:hypothetical protein